MIVGGANDCYYMNLESARRCHWRSALVEQRRQVIGLGPPNRPLRLLMDKAYEGGGTRQLAPDPGFISVVAPKSNRVEPWGYDREMYKHRNEVERLLRHPNDLRRIFSQFDKLDVMFIAFINFAFIVD